MAICKRGRGVVNRRKQCNEPVRKRVRLRARHDWFWLGFLLVEKVARNKGLCNNYQEGGGGWGGEK